MNAFSVEFIKLYQIICSEVDVTAKCLCSVIGTPPSSNAGINKWKPLILAHFPEFSQQEITVISYDISLKPLGFLVAGIRAKSSLVDSV